MAIIRHHHDKEFTIVPNSIFNDKNLNLRDIGLLCYLLHLPDGWDFSIKGLTAVIPNDGRDGIAASLRRIESAGYLHREQERQKNGTLGDFVWIISDVPLPKTDYPYTAEPNTANPSQIKNIQDKESKEQRTDKRHNGATQLLDGVDSVIEPKVFSKLAAQEYEKIAQGGGYPYSLEEVLSVFNTFFTSYEQYMGEKHPALKREQIKNIIEAMPYTDDVHHSVQDIEPEFYEEMIDAYFNSNFENCDYRISHFMAGNIRMMRIYETIM